MSTDWLCDPRLLTPEKLEVYQDTVREKCGDTIADEMLGHLAAMEAFLDKMQRTPFSAFKTVGPSAVIIATGPTSVSIPWRVEALAGKNVLGVLWMGHLVSDEMREELQVRLEVARAAGLGLHAEPPMVVPEGWEIDTDTDTDTDELLDEAVRG